MDDQTSSQEGVVSAPQIISSSPSTYKIELQGVTWWGESTDETEFDTKWAEITSIIADAAISVEAFRDNESVQKFTSDISNRLTVSQQETRINDALHKAVQEKFDTLNVNYTNLNNQKLKLQDSLNVQITQLTLDLNEKKEEVIKLNAQLALSKKTSVTISSFSDLMGIIFGYIKFVFRKKK